MAKLPGIDQVVGQPLPTPKPSGEVATYQATSGQEGARAAALQSAGQDLTQAGVMIQAGVDKYDEIAAENAITKLTDQRLTMEAEAKKVRGEDAAKPDFLTTNQQKFVDTSKAISEGLTNENQKRLFGQRAQVAGLQFKASVLNHQAGEMDNFAKLTAAGMINSGIQAAGMYAEPSPYNNQQVAIQLDRAYAGAVKLGAANGMGPTSDFVKNEQARIRDEVMSTRILTVAQTDPLQAKVMFNEAKDTLSPKARLAVESHITPMANNWIAKTEGQNVVKDALKGASEDFAKADVPTNPISPAQTRPQNNPGNMRPGGQFASYANPEQGFAAMVNNLQGPLYAGAGKTSVSQIINTWAPPESKGGDNSQASVTNYVKHVSAALGVAPDAKLNLQDPATLAKLTYAMAQFEQGAKNPFTPAQAAAGVDQSLKGTFKGVGQAPATLDRKTDLAARTDQVRLAAEKKAEALFPGNPNMRDSMVAEALGGWAKVVAGQAALENNNSQIALNAVMGGSPDGTSDPSKLPTTWSDLRSDPKVAQALDQMPAQSRLHIATLLAANAATVQGKITKVDGAVYMDVLNKVQSGQITENYQLTPFLANGLGIQHRQDFEKMIADRRGGKDVLQGEVVELAGAVKQQWMKNPLISYNPQLASQVNDSLMAWHQSVQKDIAAANAIPDPAKRATTIRELFDPNSKTFVGGAYAQRFMPKSADVAKGLPQAAQIQTADQVAKLPAPPPGLDEAGMQSWVEKLPPGTPFQVNGQPFVRRGVLNRNPPRGQDKPRAPQG